MGHLRSIRRVVSAYFLLVFIFAVHSVESNPQIQISSSDDFFKKHLNQNPFPEPSSSFDPDWFKNRQEEHRKEFDENSEKAVKIFWVITGIIIVIFVISIISACCCFFVPACCLAQSMAKRRNRGQGHIILSPNGTPDYPAQAHNGGGLGGYPGTTGNQSNYPYPYPPASNNMAQQPLAAEHLQQLPYYPAAPPPGPMGFDAKGQQPYSPYYNGNNSEGYPGPMMTNNPPPPPYTHS